MFSYCKMLIVGFLLFVSMAACQSESPTPVEKPALADQSSHQAPQPNVSHGMPQAPHDMPSQEPIARAPRPVIVAPEVAEKWKEVNILVTDKKTGEAISYKVSANSVFSIPNTTFKLKIGAFIPDFKITDEGIMSDSAEANNPGLQVAISENDAEKYSGWLFSKMPDIHAFEHERYQIVLENKFETAKGEEEI